MRRTSPIWIAAPRGVEGLFEHVEQVACPVSGKEQPAAALATPPGIALVNDLRLLAQQRYGRYPQSWLERCERLLPGGM